MKIVINDIEEEYKPKLNRFKQFIKYVTEFGTGSIMGGIVSLTTSGVLWPVKICAYLSSYIMSEIITEKTDSYIDEHFVIEENNTEEG